MRLDYFLAHATHLSRKDAKRAIQQGRVRVAGEVEKKTAATVTADADISLDGQSLTLEQGHRYLMLNKPAGVVSATADGLHQTVLDLLPQPLRHDLHPVGRLDRDTTGLLLLTTDGQWSHRITSPRRGCAKVYRACLAEPIGAEALAQLEIGVILRGGPETTRPARVEILDERMIRLTLTEGRYHQVKRMLAAVGNHVTGLHRERVGGIVLDEGLAPGGYRVLSAVEVDSV